jgi:type II secretory ATPase GspE/PulE/Tfp pilus assembly ATPase PilB-like protein
LSIEEKLYPKISESLVQTGTKFPEFLSRSFARILQRIEVLWGSKEVIDYLDSLFLGDFPDEKKALSERSVHSLNLDNNLRQGFSMEVVKEIVLLKQVHQFLHPSINFDPYDTFSFSNTETLVPIDIRTKKSVGADESPSGDADSDTFNPRDPASSDSNHLIDWPVIHTQHELFEYAELMHKGANVYPLQGRQVGEILMHFGIIDEHTLRVVTDMQKRPAHNKQSIGEILVEVGIIKQDELTRSLFVQAGILTVDALSIVIPTEVFKAIPSAKTREKFVLPVGCYHGILYLAVANPLTFQERKNFESLCEMNIGLVFSPRHEIINRLNMYGSGKTSLEPKEEFHIPVKKSHVTGTAESDEEKSGLDYTVAENDTLIVDLVNQIILGAVERSASDIHLELFQNSDKSNVRLRLENQLEHFFSFPGAYHQVVVSRLKTLSGLDIAEKRRPQEGVFSYILPDNKQIGLRVVTIPALNGTEFVTLHLLAFGEPLPLADIGMVKRDLQVLRELLLRRHGFILVCGPSGSGKTFTLHSVLDALETGQRKICTAEDPVEIVQSHLCQVQVNSKIGITFASIVRALVNSDPDVIMIGEVREPETAKIALEASMNGQLVLSSLHTHSAVESLTRLIDLGIDPYGLSDVLLAIVSQRLARRLCPVCARRAEASAHDLDALANEYYQSAHLKAASLADRQAIIQTWRENIGFDGNLYLLQAVGCDLCNGGYKGHIGLFELLQSTPSLRDLIRRQAPASDYLAAGVANGMLTLKQDGIEKILRGHTDLLQVHSACI